MICADWDRIDAAWKFIALPFSGPRAASIWHECQIGDLPAAGLRFAAMPV
jgi:hypothetical protein